jgi:RNA polymerase sigma-70 factor, ECF subfamily
MDQALVLEDVPLERKIAFERLFHERYGDILAYLYRLVGDRKQAEDLTQDTFLKAYRAWPDLPAGANVRAWLYRIGTNTALDWLRRRRLIAWLPLFERDNHPAVRTCFAETVLETVAVQRALAQIPARYRVPLVLYACQGLATCEIAEILHISRGAVKTRLFRAREKFRRVYVQVEEGS